MRAIEFKTKIRDNQILIPRRNRSDLFVGRDTSVRVIIFVEDPEEKAYRQMTKSQFLKVMPIRILFIRVHKMATLEKDMIETIMGKIDETVLGKVKILYQSIL